MNGVSIPKFDKFDEDELDRRLHLLLELHIADFAERLPDPLDIPVQVGGGIRTPEASRDIASVADGAVVGSAIVAKMGDGEPPAEVLKFVKGLADGAHAA